MKKMVHFLAMVICIAVALSGCSSQERYLPAAYEKTDIIEAYRNDREHFLEVVKIFSSNTTFLKNGRINQFSDWYISSPLDKNLTWFNETEKTVILDFFDAYEPYMVSLDYSKRFVEITFINSDRSDGYCLLFWIRESSNSEFNEYKIYLSYSYYIEYIDNNCILVFPKDQQQNQ